MVISVICSTINNMMSELIFQPQCVYFMIEKWEFTEKINNIVLIAIKIIAFIKIKPTTRYSHQLNRSIVIC